MTELYKHIFNGCADGRLVNAHDANVPKVVPLFSFQLQLSNVMAVQDFEGTKKRRCWSVSHYSTSAKCS